METAYCLSLTLLLAAPLVTTTHEEEADNYDSYSDSAEGDGEEVVAEVLPSSARPGPTEVRDILDDNYHMFRRKRAARSGPTEVKGTLYDMNYMFRRRRAAGGSERGDEEENNVPVFHNFDKKMGPVHQRSKTI